MITHKYKVTASFFDKEHIGNIEFDTPQDETPEDIEAAAEVAAFEWATQFLKFDIQKLSTKSPDNSIMDERYECPKCKQDTLKVANIGTPSPINGSYVVEYKCDYCEHTCHQGF